MTRTDRLVEALLGVAIGDALGFPFEGKPREQLATVDLSHLPAGRFPPGTWSDDTALTFITAESLYLSGALDLNDLAGRFLRWLKEGYFTPFGQALGIGRATREALLRLEKGVPPEEAGGKGERDNGNGSLMRLLPVALWYAKDPLEEALTCLHKASSLTHAHPRSLVACGLFGLLVRKIVAGKALKTALLETAKEGPHLYASSPFREELTHYTPLFEGKIFLEKEEGIISSGYVVHTLLAAFWVLYRTEDFATGVKLAVRLGGDTDTLAAVVGGVAGLYYGLASVPESWLNGLQKRELLEQTAHEFARRLGERWRDLNQR